MGNKRPRITKKDAVPAQKGRVGDDELELMFKLGQDHLEREIQILESMFAEETPVDDAGGRKRTTVQMKMQRAQAIRTQLTVVKELTKLFSGAVHPMGRNTLEEKNAADDLMNSIREEMKSKGVSGICDPDFNPRKKDAAGE